MGLCVVECGRLVWGVYECVVLLIFVIDVVVWIGGFVIGVRVCEVNKFVENVEFEFEFDGVGYVFVGGLELVEIGVFEVKDGDVEEDNYDIDDYEVLEYVGLG